MNVSEFYGKKTVSTNGKTGYVLSVNAAAGKIVCLVCADEDEKEFTIDVKNVISIGEKIIYEDRESAIKSSVPVRLGRAGFDDSGKYLGEVEDFTFNKDTLQKAKIGNKSYPASGLIYGDVILVKRNKRLKSDVVKDGKVIIKKGTPLTEKVLSSAEKQGEYIQTNLKSL